jgi:Putative restriction endonuclease
MNTISTESYANTQPPIPKRSISWPILPEDFILPDDPVENIDQPPLAAALKQPLTRFGELMQDALVVSNFALCAEIDDRIICKAPDWMYIKPVNPWRSTQPRRSYTPHTEGTIPSVVMEFISATYGDEYSVESIETIGKWFFYEQVIQVPYYVIFRPSAGRLEVYGLECERYRAQTPNEFGRYWIVGLDLFLGVWEGSHEGRTGYWLRWWDAEGNILLWSEETAEQERQRAEQERQQKELAQQQLEQTERLLEEERVRSQALLERLRQMGIDPEQF